MEAKAEVEEIQLCEKKSRSQNESEKSDSLSYFSVYRYAEKLDYFLIFIGIIVTIIKSLAMPIFVAVYGEFTTIMVERTLMVYTSTPTTFLHVFGGGEILTNASLEENREAIRNDSIAFGITIGVCALVQLLAGIICIDCFNHTAIRQISRIRIKYFESFIRQEIGWHDVASGNDNFAVRVTDDIEKIRDGMGEKVSHFLALIIGFVIYMSMAFIYGWKLTLTIIAYVPIAIISTTYIGKRQASLTAKETDSYSAAANVAEEVLSGIRTVFAFCGEKVELKRYNSRLVKAKSAVKRKGFWSGLGDGIMRFLLFGSVAIGFWYGVQLVLDDRVKEDKEYTPAVLLITTFSILNAANCLAQIAPFMEVFATARGSAATIFRVINRVSKIDSMSTEGERIGSALKGNISFKKINFSYPSRPDVQILQDFELEIQPGQSVALVGHSGNGKSTCLQLLQRFYDPNDGQVLIDGSDIRSININELRSLIATVGQEPVLFSTTIGENIRYGKPGATEQEVIEAAKNSGAHDFIAKLPKGYETLVGEKGSKLSGGQKQRIAIARAFIQNPKILLLDEATSALDYQSEKYVQETLNKVSEGRTTIVVSHRLSAIRDANRIVFIENGHVIEDGTHNELMALKGRYFEMITSGNMESENEGEDKNECIDDTTKANGSKQNGLERNGSQRNDQKTSERANELETLIENNENVHETKQQKEKIHYWKLLTRLLSLAKQERIFIIAAFISSILIGGAWPVYTLLFGDVFGALSLVDGEEVYEKTKICCILFIVLGIVALTLAITQAYLFAKSSANLTSKLRSMAFEAMMRQECAWFDNEDNSSAVLSTRLSGDATSVQTAIGFPVTMVTMSLSTFVIGLIISLVFSVKLALVCSIAAPVAVLSVVFGAKYTAKTTMVEKQSIETGTKIATEAITNIRTVASLRQEKPMIDRYVEEVEKAEQIIKKTLVLRGVVNSTPPSIPFFIYAAGLTYGGILVSNGEMHYKNVIKSTENLLCGIIMLSQSLIHIPTITAAFVGAHRLLQIIDREPLITSPNVSNKNRIPDDSNNIDFQKVDFRYPTRPDVQILKKFCLSVEEGKTIALVGPSGCGKSTVIQLLQRFYDPERGRISIGIDEISRDISLPNLRSKLSIVSQEPVLFDKTIAENIAYGDNTRDVSMDEIIAAAKIANVHDFVTQLPLGYETNVGSKSAQLSGGQKQRIAIARALIRNPKILLLDEATSALDLRSEQVVQQALDAAQSGRTCLVIAHRLSTIQNADAIYVVQNGSIVEHGTHSELLALDGIYTRLYNAQK